MTLALAVLLSACGTTDQQECNPTAVKTRCDPGQKCAVDAGARPRCYADDGGGTAEGEACETPDECARGMGCIDVFGVSRCARFCDPDDIDGSSDPCTAGAADDRFSEGARCVARLPSQTAIGICVPPCELGTNAGCPAADGVRCLLPLGVPYAICGTTPGKRTVAAGAACGATAPCDIGVCLRRGNGAVCREAAPAEGCGDGELTEQVPDSSDPLASNAPYEVCAPCAVLGKVGERWNQVCFTLGATAAGAAGACLADDAGLLRVDTAADAQQVVEQLATVRQTPWWDPSGDPLGPDEVGFWTRARRTAAGWVWHGSEDPVDPALWADGTPPATGDSAVLRLDGALHLPRQGGAFPMCSLGAAARASVDLGMGAE